MNTDFRCKIRVAVAVALVLGAGTGCATVDSAAEAEPAGDASSTVAGNAGDQSALPESGAAVLSASEFDLDSYEGKVVILNFWATWCGPCIAELPNMQKNYEKYHDKGFEIVAVSLDTDRKRVETFLKERKLPWKTLYNDDAKANGFNHPLAVHYGITAIPSMFLVDQKGNVVSLQARGSVLTKKLEELLGKIEAAQ